MAATARLVVEILHCVQDDMSGVRRSYWVYILANWSRVLYVGMTNDLARRVAEHQAGEGRVFTRRYNARRLVHAEEHVDVRDAIRREKELKGWRREKKVALIEGANPHWRDLAAAETRP